MATHGRLVLVNQTVFDQADFFQGDGFTRVAGLTAVDLTSQVFHNNQLVPWGLVVGASVTNNQVVSGSVYFHEIAGTVGNYSIRFRPNAVGYWRLVLVYVDGSQIVAQDYDVAEPAQSAGGLRSSFTNC